jgi:hypothetical protein
MQNELSAGMLRCSLSDLNLKAIVMVASSPLLMVYPYAYDLISIYVVVFELGSILFATRIGLPLSWEPYVYTNLLGPISCAAWWVGESR